MSIELTDVVGDIEGGRFPSALVRLKRRLAAFPAEIDSLFLQGFLAHVSGQPTLAPNLRLLAVAPGNAAAAANAAGVLVEQGALVRARRLLRRALALDPGFPPAHANLGLCLLREGTSSLAIGVLKRTLQLGPPEPMTLLNLGAALDSAGRKAEAQAAYRVALVISPDFARAIYNEAVLAQGRGEVEAAIESQLQAWQEASPSEKAEFRRQLDTYRAGQKSSGGASGPTAGSSPSSGGGPVAPGEPK